MSQQAQKEPRKPGPEVQINLTSGTQRHLTPGQSGSAQTSRLSPDASARHSRDLRTPSPGPSRTFYSRLQKTLPRISWPKSSGSTTKGTDSTTTADSYHPVIRTRALEWTDKLNPDNITNAHDGILCAPAYTHLDALLYRKTQYFLTSAKKAFKYTDECRKILGFVAIFKQKECSKETCVKCPACSVCPHLIRCSCRLKFRSTEWCPHQHMLQELTLGCESRRGIVLFVQKNWNFTETRHFQAFIEGRKRMEKLEEKKDDCWVEQLIEPSKEETKAARVTENAVTGCDCPDDRKCVFCDACLCKYSCTCEDHSISMQVCSHIHCVAMQNNPKLFKDLGDWGKKLPIATTDVNAPITDLNFRYFMEQEHALSCYFDLKANDITKKKLSNSPRTTWTFCYPDTSDLWTIVTQLDDWKNICFCKEDELTMKGNVCELCDICTKHYSCSCDASKFVLCRHAHAVCRFEVSDTRQIEVETYETKARRVRDLCSWISSKTESLNINTLTFTQVELNTKRFGETDSSMQISCAQFLFRSFDNQD